MKSLDIANIKDIEMLPLIVFEGFIDYWCDEKYTLSTTKGYMTFPTKEEAIIYLNEIKAEYRKEDLK